jgi:hypothetical protein
LILLIYPQKALRKLISSNNYVFIS